MKLLTLSNLRPSLVDASVQMQTGSHISSNVAWPMTSSQEVDISSQEKPRLVEKRGVTTTITSSFTNTVFITSFINQTITTFFTIEKNFTIPTTVLQPTTMIHNITTTDTVTLTASVTNSRSSSEPATLARIAPGLVVSQSSFAKDLSTPMLLLSKTRTSTSSGASLPVGQTPTTTSMSNTKSQVGISPAGIAGIVAGILAFLGLFLAGLLLMRRFYRMYRRERVLRKQIQTEGNEMPVMQTADERSPMDEIGQPGK